MSVKHCNHKTFMAVYDDDTIPSCPACAVIEEKKTLQLTIKTFVQKCIELGFTKEDEG